MSLGERYGVGNLVTPAGMDELCSSSWLLSIQTNEAARSAALPAGGLTTARENSPVL